MEESNPELESFRQKWKEEVSARSNAGPSRPPRRHQAAARLGTDRVVKSSQDEDDHIDPQLSHGSEPASGPPGNEYGESSGSKAGSREPRSALEHYEKAVERETQGSLGDSLDLYRKAFKASS
jgi:F-box protein 9